MSVVTQADFDENASDFEIYCMEINDLCFFCGEKLSFPYVYWHGSHGVMNGWTKGISMHAECAKHLARGITKDALKIESKEAK